MIAVWPWLCLAVLFVALPAVKGTVAHVITYAVFAAAVLAPFIVIAVTNNPTDPFLR